MKTRFSTLLGIGMMLAAWPLSAHHSFSAEFDSNKPITLDAKVTKMDWVNPHSWIHVEAVNPDSGKTESWDVETGPPNTLYRNGWRRDSLKPGDAVVITGTRAKNGTNTVNARSVKTTDGKTMLAGSSEGNSAGAPPPTNSKQ